MFKFTIDDTTAIRVCIDGIEPGYKAVSIDPRDWTCVPEEHKSTLVHEFQNYLENNDYKIDYEASIRSLNYSAIPRYVVYQYDYSDWEEEIV
jgi:hypothetical protein